MSIQSELQKILWPSGTDGRTEVYAILDGARDELVHAWVQASYLENCCLYSGDLPKEMLTTAPWLVRLESGNKWTNRILARAWSNSWGVFLRTETSVAQLRNHLRRFLRVRDESGRILLFRYYDPRVLRVYLPTCTSTELSTVFGPVQAFIVENSRGTSAFEFGFTGGKLTEKQIQVGDADPAGVENTCPS